MPVNVGPLSARCKSCGWTKPVHTQGDVVFDCPSSCPRCGSVAIEMERTRGIAGVAETLIDNIKRIFSSR